MSAPPYEFDETQNSAFESLSRNMRVVGLAQLAVGGLQAVLSAIALLKSNFGGAVTNLAQAVLLGLIGFWTLNASRYVLKIATTSGSDIEHLMNAIGELRKLYRLQRLVLVLAIVAIAVGVLFLMYQSR